MQRNRIGMDTGEDRSTTSPMNQDPEHIKRDIEDSRSNMSRTLGKIQDKLRPGSLVNNVRRNARSAADKGWKRMSESSGRAYSAARDRAGRAYEATRSQADHALNDYPLATAGAALGIGFVIGSLLPLTSAERRLGRQAGSLREKADQKLSEWMSKGNERIEESLESSDTERQEPSSPIGINTAAR